MTSPLPEFAATPASSPWVAADVPADWTAQPADGQRWVVQPTAPNWGSSEADTRWSAGE